VTFFAGKLKEGNEQVVPVQSPEKPENLLPTPAVPPSATLVLASNVRLQVAVQGVAAPPKSTVPEPLPAKVTFTSTCAMKLAVALRSLFSVMEQVAPVHASLHAPKREPGVFAVGVSVATVPS
jgi:hypothetical protein